MRTTTAPGSTSAERIAYWRAQGWPLLQAMMTPGDTGSGTAADHLSAPEVSVVVRVPAGLALLTLRSATR